MRPQIIDEVPNNGDIINPKGVNMLVPKISDNMRGLVNIYNSLYLLVDLNE